MPCNSPKCAFILRTKLLEYLSISAEETDESVTLCESRVRTVCDFVTRSRERLIGVRYQSCRANRFDSRGRSKTPPSHITPSEPFDWLELVLALDEN